MERVRTVEDADRQREAWARKRIASLEDQIEQKANEIKELEHERDDLNRFMELLRASRSAFSRDGTEAAEDEELVHLKDYLVAAFQNDNPREGHKAAWACERIQRFGFPARDATYPRVSSELWRLSQGDDPVFEKVSRGHYRLIEE